MTSPKANGYFHTLDPDVQLIKKSNTVLKQLEEYEFDDELLIIKSQLYAARTAFLNACVNEANDNLYYHTEKSKAYIRLESTIELFEKLHEEICVE